MNTYELAGLLMATARSTRLWPPVISNAQQQRLVILQAWQALKCATANSKKAVPRANRFPSQPPVAQCRHRAIRGMPLTRFNTAGKGLLGIRVCAAQQPPRHCRHDGLIPTGGVGHFLQFHAERPNRLHITQCRLRVLCLEAGGEVDDEGLVMRFGEKVEEIAVKIVTAVPVLYRVDVLASLPVCALLFRLSLST